MSPIVREVNIGPHRLIQGDALAVLPHLDGIDACVTDPPYGVLDEAWDDMDAHELAAFTMAWVGRVRMLTDTAVIFFGQKTRATINSILGLLFPEIRQVIWSKGQSGVAADGMFFSYESAYLCRSSRPPIEIVGPKSTAFANEMMRAREAAGMSKGGIDVAVRGKKTGICYRWEEGACLPTDEQVAVLRDVLSPGPAFFDALTLAKSERDRNIEANLQRTRDGSARLHDVLRYPVQSGIDHPSPKPVGLMQDLCSLVEGDTILDPFMGSGSTGVACVREGRRFIGIERDPKHFTLAVKRISDAYAQPDLLHVAPPTAAIQESFLP